MSTYLWIDLGAFLVPFIFSFHPRLRFDRTWYALWPAIGCMMLLFIPWDAWFTHLGIWGFNEAHLSGFALLGLPLEEWLFFICIPYACVFTYHCFRVLGVKDYFAKRTELITWVLIFAPLIIIVFFPGKAYTASAFGGLAMWLLILRLWVKPAWLGRAYFAYLVLLIPFLVVNGILTGSFLEEAVVWYNDGQNLGVRIGTIPLEDVFYGLFMFLMTVTVYEALLKRRAVKGLAAEHAFGSQGRGPCSAEAATPRRGR
ncbi:MAG: lycopene cyclase domain-containing protein [Flavobacteriales bacterium]